MEDMKILLLGLVVSVFLVACGFFGVSDDVIIRWPEGGLPIYDGAYPASWKVRWLNSSDRVSEKTVDSAQGPLVLELPRESPLIVMAVPITVEYAAPYRVRAAGVVVGADLPLPGNLQFSWEDGFSAQLLLSLVDAGISSHAINQRRFAESARKRSNNRPWLLDEKQLRRDITGGKLRTYSFRLLEVFEIKAALPEGTWYSQFPLDPPLIASQNGWQGVLPRGLWHFARPADAEIATISVDSNGNVLLRIGD